MCLNVTLYVLDCLVTIVYDMFLYAENKVKFFQKHCNLKWNISLGFD